MPDVNLPLSGAVDQTINPWTAYLTAIGNQFSFISVNVGQSTNPDVERTVLNEVGMYGKQLGRTEEALLVLLKHVLPAKEKLHPDEAKAVEAFRTMMSVVAEKKEKAGSALIIRP
jgi:hypothetical protein